MAKTAFATGNALTKKLWEEKLFRDTLKETYFNKFSGESADNIIQTKTALEKEKGDKITFGIRMRLAGAGVTSGQTLEGNEEKLTTYDNSITLERYRHAVRDAGELDRQRVMFSIDEESVAAIKGWGAEKQDQLVFDALLASPTSVFYKTSSGVLRTATFATAKSGITVAADSKLTPTMISFIRAWAKTGGNRTNALTPLRPVKVEGRSYYVLLVHPDVMYDLKIDSTFTQAMREAEVRGPSNPLFQGATAIWDGVVVHEHENIPIATDGGGGAIPWANCIFMGAQAGLLAWGKRPEVIQEEFDYKEEHGYAIAMTMKAGKSTFNSKDYGSVGVVLSRTNVAGS